MTRLLLVRHGESEANKEKRFAGHSDFPLSDRGLLQAERTADHVVSFYQVDAVYASDLKRAYATADAVAGRLSLSVTPHEGFREIFAGEWEGMLFDELPLRYPDDFAIWCQDIGRARCTGGESVADLQRRVLSALCELAEQNPGKTLLIGTHATPIRAIQCHLEGRPLSEMHAVPWVSNASLTEIEYENGVLRLVLVGEDRHLADLTTVLPKNV